MTLTSLSPTVGPTDGWSIDRAVKGLLLTLAAVTAIGVYGASLPTPQDRHGHAPAAAHRFVSLRPAVPVHDSPSDPGHGTDPASGKP